MEKLHVIVSAEIFPIFDRALGIELYPKSTENSPVYENCYICTYVMFLILTGSLWCIILTSYMRQPGLSVSECPSRALVNGIAGSWSEGVA